MKALQNSGMFDNKMLDAFGLKNHGHRKYNHGIDGAFFSAYMVSPEHAVDLAMTHLMLDKMGNLLNDTVGNDEKDIVEGTINKFCSVYRENVLGIKPRRKRMYF